MFFVLLPVGSREQGTGNYGIKFSKRGNLKNNNRKCEKIDEFFYYFKLIRKNWR